jgi:hypothetical protein
MIEKLPDSGEASLAILEQVKEEDLPVAEGSVLTTLPLLGVHEAYRITLSKTSR